MKLKLNGTDRELESVRTAADLLAALDIVRERVAIMVNETVVRRADLDATELHDGDVVEVITMVGGG